MLYGETLDFGNIDNPLSFYYSDHGIAKLFKVSFSTAYRWRKQKLLPYFEMGVNSYYVQDVIVPLLLAEGSKGLQAALVENG